MADYQTFVDGNGEPIKDGFQNAIKEILTQKLEGEGLGKEGSPETHDFIHSLSHKLGWGYSEFDPYTNGNYAVFMHHGPWLESAEKASGQAHMTYISSMDPKKLKTKQSKILDNGNNKTESLLNFSQSISDIDVPEPSKEYIAVSTRQKNSFVNTRDFAGSDFNLTYVENKNLDVFKYHESWHKSIELIREGLLYVPEDEDAATQSDYLIPNPYSNAVYVLLFEPKSYKVNGIIALFGVMPVNLPFKNLIGDRSGSKVATYTMNYKFMDMQYAFYDDWDAFKVSAGDKESLAGLFSEFASLTSKAN